VNPLFAATFNPFAIVSRSSNPGSPRETLLSNQPSERCKLSNFISSKPFSFGILLPIFSMIPELI
jgi:hypothetical protein